MFHHDISLLTTFSVSSSPKLKMEKKPSYYFLTSGLDSFPTFSFMKEFMPV
jgi:hypothetical protein